MTIYKSIAAGFGIVAMGVVAIGVMNANKAAPPKKPVTDNSPVVEVYQPTAETVQFVVSANGVVKPRTETTLVSEVSGVVEQVADAFVAGGYFAEGDVLLQIDPTDYEVGVEQAKARLLSADAKLLQEEARVEQAKKEWKLTGKKLSSAPVLALREPFLAEAKANVQSARADLKKAQRKLARTSIRAPYAGMVKAKSVDVGQFINIGTQLGVTFAIDYAEVRLPLTDKDLAFINLPDFTATVDPTLLPAVTLNASYAGKKVRWPARLVRMEGVIDTSSRVHYAVARVNNPYSLASEKGSSGLPPLKMGTFVTAEISGITVSNLFKIPRDAFRGMAQVLVSDEERTLRKRDLKVIRAVDDYMYVHSGLLGGDKIILTALESPIAGMKLRIQGEQLDAAPISDDLLETEVAVDASEMAATKK